MTEKIQNTVKYIQLEWSDERGVPEFRVRKYQDISYCEELEKRKLIANEIVIITPGRKYVYVQDKFLERGEAKVREGMVARMLADLFAMAGKLIGINQKVVWNDKKDKTE